MTMQITIACTWCNCQFTSGNSARASCKTAYMTSSLYKLAKWLWESTKSFKWHKMALWNLKYPNHWGCWSFNSLSKLKILLKANWKFSSHIGTVIWSNCLNDTGSEAWSAYMSSWGRHNDEMIRLRVKIKYSRFPSMGSFTCLSVECSVSTRVPLALHHLPHDANEDNFKILASSGIEPGTSCAASRQLNPIRLPSEDTSGMDLTYFKRPDQGRLSSIEIAKIWDFLENVVWNAESFQLNANNFDRKITWKLENLGVFIESGVNHWKFLDRPWKNLYTSMDKQ